MRKTQGLAWTLIITIIAVILFLICPVDATEVTKAMNLYGTVSEDSPGIRAELAYGTLTYDGMKHLPSFICNGAPYLEPKAAKKNSISDLVIYLTDVGGSDILSSSTPSYGIKNNKSISTEKKKGEVYIRLKPKKHISSETRSRIAALNKEMKSKAFEFTISPMDISKCKVEIEKKPDGSVKSVYVTVDGKKLRLSKKDFTVDKTENGAIILTGQRLCTGVYTEGKTELPDPADPGDDYISTATDDNAVRKMIAGLNVSLLKTSGISEEINSGKNVAISSYSIENALGMTANGAKGDTLTEMENVLFGGTSVGDFNKLIEKYNDHIATLSGNGFETNLANGIWVNGLKVKKEFGDLVTDAYKAGISDKKFDENTAGEINQFVSTNTRGMIQEIINKTDDDMAMVLVNALYLQGVWDEDFAESSIIPDQIFTDHSGTEKKVTMLEDDQSSVYFRYKGADGIIKNLKDGKGRFIAILPKKDTTLSEFIKGMDADVMAQIEDGEVPKCILTTRFPEFEYEYDTELAGAMSELGVKKAFTPYGDLSGLIEPGQIREPLYIDKVLHKTHVKVDREGAKAAAATAVIVNKATSCGPDDTIYKRVIFDRPFIYMLTDDGNVPLFIGTVSEIGQ